MEKTLVFLKPDFFEKDLYQEFLDVLKKYDLGIDLSFYFRFETLNDVKNFYQWENLWNIEMMFKYWCIKPHQALVVEGINTIQKTIEIKKLFRNKYCINCHEMYTLIHCSDTFKDYEREVEFLLTKKLVL